MDWEKILENGGSLLTVAGPALGYIAKTIACVIGIKKSGEKPTMKKVANKMTKKEE